MLRGGKAEWWNGDGIWVHTDVDLKMDATSNHEVSLDKLMVILSFLFLTAKR